MSKEKIKFLLMIMLMLCTVIVANPSVVLAASDTQASTYGFDVDLDYYKTTVWYNTVTTNVKLDGNIIGVCKTNIGMTRAKQKATGGYKMDHVFVRCIMKGKNPKTNYAGYAEHLTIQSTLPSKTELMAYSPEQIATKVSYDIGINASSDKSVGISASTTFTKNALEINSYSDTDSGYFKACYDYQHAVLRPNWSLNKYSYNESKQRAHWVIKTSNSKYSTKIVVKPKFQWWSATPGYWASQYSRYSIVNQKLTLTTPY